MKVSRQKHKVRLHSYYIQSFNQLLYQSQNPDPKTDPGTPLNPFSPPTQRLKMLSLRLLVEQQETKDTASYS